MVQMHLSNAQSRQDRSKQQSPPRSAANSELLSQTIMDRTSSMQKKMMRTMGPADQALKDEAGSKNDTLPLVAQDPSIISAQQTPWLSRNQKMQGFGDSQVEKGAEFLLDTIQNSLESNTQEQRGSKFSNNYKIQPMNVNLFAKSKRSLPLPMVKKAVPVPSNPSFRLKNSPRGSTDMNIQESDMQLLNHSSTKKVPNIEEVKSEELGEVTPTIQRQIDLIKGRVDAGSGLTADEYQSEPSGLQSAYSS